MKWYKGKTAKRELEKDDNLTGLVDETREQLCQYLLLLIFTSQLAFLPNFVPKPSNANNVTDMDTG